MAFIPGTIDDDDLNGTEFSDIITGEAGNDTLDGGTGGIFDADFLYGNAGNDRLFGNEGNDYLDGGDNRDTLVGDNGNDIIVCGNGDDRDAAPETSSARIVYSRGSGSLFFNPNGSSAGFGTVYFPFLPLFFQPSAIAYVLQPVSG
ncbi:MAG: hypothetical protein IGS54_23870 [Elainella sp. C42_A2020_010]|nr:hypothetical protein [Elainella sp. C42_A2020_010]